MAELADAADSKSCGRPKRRLAKCSSFFVFQHIQLSAQNRPCGSVRSGTVLLWPDGYSLVTVELIFANMVRGARGGGLLNLLALFASTAFHIFFKNLARIIRERTSGDNFAGASSPEESVGMMAHSGDDSW